MEIEIRHITADALFDEGTKLRNFVYDIIWYDVNFHEFCEKTGGVKNAKRLSGALLNRCATAKPKYPPINIFNSLNLSARFSEFLSILTNSLNQGFEILKIVPEIHNGSLAVHKKYIKKHWNMKCMMFTIKLSDNIEITVS